MSATRLKPSAHKVAALLREAGTQGLTSGELAEGRYHLIAEYPPPKMEIPF